MQIYDPQAHIARDLDTCEVAEHVAGLIPIMSMKDEQWFVVDMLSGHSRLLTDLQSEDLCAVRESISSHLFLGLLLSRCHQARGSSEESSKGEAILTRADYARLFGTRAIESAERCALEAGFTQDDIGLAYNILESKDPAADVPATKVSDLQKAP